MTDQDPQPRRRRRPAPDAPPAAQGSIAKGAILVAVAVIIGFVLIRDDGIQGQSSAIGADTGGDVEETPDDSAPDETTDSSTSSVPEARDPADVRVLIANGTNVNGAAGRFNEALISAGYDAAGAVDALDKSATATFVYFTPGYEAEARAVAAELGASAENVTAQPSAPVVADTKLANVIVVIGPDLASG